MLTIGGNACVAFPRLFNHDELGGFECVVSVLVNWCPDWFQTFPHPPVGVLNGVEARIYIAFIPPAKYGDASVWGSFS